eukprot:5970934-Lingulodinium_polyedra.AAC.1
MAQPRSLPAPPPPPCRAAAPQQLPGVPGTQLVPPPPAPTPLARRQSQSPRRNLQARMRAQNMVAAYGSAQPGQLVHFQHEIYNRMPVLCHRKGQGKGKDWRWDTPSLLTDPETNDTIRWHPEETLDTRVTDIVYHCPICTANLERRGWPTNAIE